MVVGQLGDRLFRTDNNPDDVLPETVGGFNLVRANDETVVYRSQASRTYYSGSVDTERERRVELQFSARTDDQGFIESFINDPDESIVQTARLISRPADEPTAEYSLDDKQPLEVGDDLATILSEMNTALDADGTFTDHINAIEDDLMQPGHSFDSVNGENLNKLEVFDPASDRTLNTLDEPLVATVLGYSPGEPGHLVVEPHNSNDIVGLTADAFASGYSRVDGYTDEITGTDAVVQDIVRREQNNTIEFRGGSHERFDNYDGTIHIHDHDPDQADPSFDPTRFGGGPRL